MQETNQAKTDISGKAKPFDERAIISRVKNGDTNAFCELAVQYQNRLYNAIFRMVNSVEDTRDICQEVLIKAFRNIGSFRGDSAFLTFLYRIAFNESVLYRNRRKKMIIRDFKSDLPGRPGKEIDNNGDHAADIQIKDSNKYIQNVLNSLEPKLREVVILKDVEDFSYAEVARALNISVSQVRTDLGQAREILREKLKNLI